MKFSVLLSVYYKENVQFLQQAFDSIWDNQILKPHEIVLVLDGKLNDQLYKKINELQHHIGDALKVVTLETNVGLGRALNIGLSHCSYKYVARMDTDDICTPDRFQKQVDYLINHPEVDLLGGQIAEFEVMIGDINSKRILPTSHNDIVTIAKTRCPFNHPSVIYNKNAVINAGSYQNDHLYEDYALWVRMIHNGAKVANLPDIILNMRAGAAMFDRRGGFKYATSEVSAQLNFYRIGFISAFQLIKNVCTRFPVRIAPNWIRSFIYKNLLRK